MRDVQTDLSSVLIYVYVRALIRLGLSVGLSVCKKECIHVRNYVCMCEHLSVCMYVFAYSYIHILYHGKGTLPYAKYMRASLCVYRSM